MDTSWLCGFLKRFLCWVLNRENEGDFLTLFDRVRWMTSLEFASFLYDVQLRAVMYDREGLGLMSVPALHSWLLRDASLRWF